MWPSSIDEVISRLPTRVEREKPQRNERRRLDEWRMFDMKRANHFIVRAPAGHFCPRQLYFGTWNLHRRFRPRPLLKFTALITPVKTTELPLIP
jgi:hypothetical protein